MGTCVGSGWASLSRMDNLSLEGPLLPPPELNQNTVSRSARTSSPSALNHLGFWGGCVRQSDMSAPHDGGLQGPPPALAERLRDWRSHANS